jgi:hypothetical protein
MRAIVQVLLMAITMAFNVPQERRVDENYKVKPGELVKLDFDFADQISITTWDKNEINVKVMVSINDNKNNDAFEIKSVKTSQGIKIVSEIVKMEELAKKNHHIKITDNGDTIINCNLEMDLFFEIKIPKNVQLDVNTIGGDIIITKFQGLSKIKTIGGFIDYSVPGDDKADIEMRTISGDIYTDLELEFDREDRGLQHIVGGDVNARLNGGGREITLETIGSNIYLRKSK